MKRTLTRKCLAGLLWLSCLSGGSAGTIVPRVDFHARLEPADGVLMGAGQVEPADVLAYAEALDRTADPIIFMDYVDAHPDNPDAACDKLEAKLAKLPWHAAVQIGLGFVDDQNKAYDKAAAEGEYDGRLRRIVGRLARLHRPVYLRIGYEFHGKWNGYTSDSYILTFRRVVGFIREAKATNIATVWCAEAGALPEDYARYYPGDDYVDWWGIDLFSTADFTVNPVLVKFMDESVQRRKPVMIGESTPKCVGTLQGMKCWQDWFARYFDWIESHANVKAFCYINWDWDYYSRLYSGDWKDWGDGRLQRSPEVSAAFRQRVSTPLYLRAVPAKDLPGLLRWSP